MLFEQNIPKQILTTDVILITIIHIKDT